jgi:ATP-dependent protease Clp ATPase subunit
MSKIICDFCGSTDTKENPVIAGDNACICKACVTAANEIMNGNHPAEETKHKIAPIEAKACNKNFFIYSLLLIYTKNLLYLFTEKYPELSIECPPRFLQTKIVE